jgi:hypothetical protein
MKTITTRGDSMNEFKRDFSIPGITMHLQSGCGTVHVTVNSQDGKIVEVYAKSGTSGGCTANMEGIGRIISIALQNGIDDSVIIEQLKSVRCPTAVAVKEKTHFKIVDKKGKAVSYFIKSCCNAVGVAMEIAKNQTLQLMKNS